MKSLYDWLSSDSDVAGLAVIVFVPLFMWLVVYVCYQIAKVIGL